MLKIFRITFKNKCERIIDKIEQAFIDKQKIAFRLSERLSKILDYLENNKERFNGYVEVKSEFDLEVEKLQKYRLQGYEINIEYDADKLRNKFVIFDFSKRSGDNENN